VLGVGAEPPLRLRLLVCQPPTTTNSVLSFPCQNTSYFIVTVSFSEVLSPLLLPPLSLSCHNTLSSVSYSQVPLRGDGDPPPSPLFFWKIRHALSFILLSAYDRCLPTFPFFSTFPSRFDLPPFFPRVAKLIPATLEFHQSSPKVAFWWERFYSESHFFSL